MNYLKEHSDKKGVTPQSQPMRSDQVENSAGGHGWAVGPFERLRRFLVLGSEGGSYYASERKLTRENIDCIGECLKADGKRTVEEIVAISAAGRAPKNDGCLYALAYAIVHGDDNAKQWALMAIPQVARIGTHLFQLCDFIESLGGGWGRAKRRAFGRWYTDKTVEQVAYQAAKYRQRGGWSHRDVLRLAHPARKVSAGNPETTVSGPHAALFEWIVKGEGAVAGLPEIVLGFTRAQAAEKPSESAKLIREFRLPREAVRPEHLGEAEVWQALLDVDMPMTAMIRNLANMTRIGLLTSQSDATQTVLAKLKNADAIGKARVHPISVLMAMRTYASGRGVRGQHTWEPVTKIIDALDGAFYTAFGNVEPTGKRILLALDVSGSMRLGEVAGVPGLSPRDASAALALVTARVEDRHEIVGFHAAGGRSYRSNHSVHGYGYEDGISPLAISPRQRLDDAIKVVSDLPFGGTDCALPMLYALDKGLEFDAFVILTDSETWAGGIHPMEALARYRKETGIAARLVTVGMVSNGFSIADPNDAGSLDLVGFDSAAPQVMSDFIAGRI